MQKESLGEDDWNMIQKYSDTVYRMAYSLAKNRYDADDIHQEVFVRYLSRKPVFENEEHEKAWFLRVTINLCRNLWKTAWKRKIVSWDVYESGTEELEKRTKERTEFASAFDVTSANGVRKSCLVMDLGDPDAALIQELTVMGLGYTDGFLRLQVCNRSFSEADRHLQPFLTDQEGNEQHEDLSVGWREEVDGERLSFTEYWFLVKEEELQNCSLSGIFYMKDGCVTGDWEVTFRAE